MVEFSRVRDRIVTRKRYPSETGYQSELYSIRSRTDPEARQRLETRLMAPIDNIAAEALQHLETSGEIPDDDRLRAGWARFLLSLMHRSPQRLAVLRTLVRETEASLLDELEVQYQATRTAADPPTYEAYATNAGICVQEETLSILLQRVVNSSTVGQAITGMVWGHVRLNNPRFGLLTGDTPIIMSNGLGTSESFMILPISPQSFFMAAASTEVIQSFLNQRGVMLERSFNDAIVRQAHEIVIAPDLRQHRFIETRLHQSRRGSLDRLGYMRWNRPRG